MKYFILILALALIACNPPTAPDVTVTVTQIVSLADGGRPDGFTNGTCAEVAKVNISAFPASLAVGQSERIDVTPKDKDNKPRDPDCDIKSGVKWTHSDACSIRDEEEFVTTVKGEKVGDCRIEACVEGKCDSETFKVS